MDDAKLAFWTRALTIVVTAVLLFSAAMLMLPSPTQLLFNLVAFGSTAYPQEVPAAARPYIIFVYRVLGAVMIGWMLAILAIVRLPFRRAEPWAWWAVTLSVGGWFSIDSVASLLSGYPGNALLNLGFGIAFAIPLLATRPIARAQL